MLFVQNLGSMVKDDCQSFALKTHRAAFWASAPLGPVETAMLNMMRDAADISIGAPAAQGVRDWAQEMPTLQRVALDDLSEVATHQVVSHEDTCTHLLAFWNGGYVQYSHNRHGALVALLTRHVQAWLDGDDAVRFGLAQGEASTSLSAPDIGADIGIGTDLGADTQGRPAVFAIDVHKRDLRVEFPELRNLHRIGVHSLSDVCEHEINRHAKSTAHALRFKHQGVLSFAYRPHGGVLRLVIRRANVHLVVPGHGLLAARSSASTYPSNEGRAHR